MYVQILKSAKRTSPFRQFYLLGETPKTPDEKIRRIVIENNRDKDNFYIRADEQLVTWIYYNPDSNRGGQYVESVFGYDLILEVARETKNFDGHEDFFAFVLGDRLCQQYLIDVGTDGFEEYDTGKPWGEPTFVGHNEKTMNGLIALAQKSKEKTKPPAVKSGKSSKKSPGRNGDAR